MFADLVPFDVETTGTDPETCRIVSAAVGRVSSVADSAMSSYLVAVDVDIPSAATEVHGITTAHAREYGKPALDVLETVAAALAQASTAGVPIVGMRIGFDLTILDRELRRWRLPTLRQRLGRPVGPVVDVSVLDRHVDQYRKGKRTLDDLCAFYGVARGKSHDATADALAAARVAYEIGARARLDRPSLLQRYADRPRQAGRIAAAFAALGQMSPIELHDAQRRWHAAQAAGLAAFFRRKATEEDQRAETATDGAERALAVADAERLRADADQVVTDWPMVD